MNVTLKNDLLTVVISSHGAELQSIRSNRSGDEFLWQGDPTFWGRRSPVLFPIVGACWDNRFRVDGEVFEMSQHGFARDCEFELVEDTSESEAWFLLESSDDLFARYPYRFRLLIGYSLVGERISVMWKVENTGEREMVFQIGAHPAFNFPDYNSGDDIHGWFNLDCRSFRCQAIEERGCIGSEEKIVELDEEMMLPLGKATFASDALIAADGQIHRCSMLDRQKRPYLTLLFDSPVVGLWSPPAGNAPFVCIEPWWGRADRIGFAGEFADREYVNWLAPGKTFRAGYYIIIDRV